MEYKTISQQLENARHENKSVDYLLWLFRLKSIFDDKFDVSSCEKQIITELQGKVSFEQAMELALFRLELLYGSGGISPGQGLEEIDRLISSFNNAPESVMQNNKGLLLRVVLFESVLCGGYVRGSNENGNVDPQVASGGKCSLGLLKKIERYPDVSERAAELVAVRVWGLLKTIPVEQWETFFEDWEIPVLLAVGKYQQFSLEPDYQSLMTIYDIIAATELYNYPEYAQMLFLRSVARVEARPESADSLASSIADIVLLLTRCNKWPANIPVRSEQVGRLLSLADDYFKCDGADPGAIIDILRPLLDSAQNGAAASGAHVPIVLSEEFYFFYASVLERRERFKEAAGYFEMVKDQELVRAATFHRCYCLFRDGSLVSDNREYYDRVVRPLRELVTIDEDIDTIDQQATELLAVIGKDSHWEELYFDRVLPVLEKLEPERAGFLVKTTLGFLTGELDVLRIMATTGSDNDYRGVQGRIFKLAVAVLGKASGSDIPIASEMCGEIATYNLCFYAVSQQFGPELAKISTLLDNSRKNLKPDSLAAVRISAFLDIARGDYGSSRTQWQRIRTSRNQQEDYFYWEARFWGIYCLILDNNKPQALHAIEVLQADIDQQKTADKWRDLWLERINALEHFSPQ